MVAQVSRRSFLRLLGLSVAGAALAACAPKPTPTPTPAPKKEEPTKPPEPTPKPTEAKITLSMVVGQNLLGFHKEHAQRWTSAHPNITIDFEGKELGPGEQRLAMLAAGTMPDIYRDALNVPPSYGIKGLVYDLVPICEAKGIIDKYIPAVWNGFKYRGGVYCLPNDTNTLCTWCNPVLFERAGIKDLMPPKTWEDVVAICKAVSKPDPDPTKAIYGHTFPTTIGWSAFFYWWWCWGHGNDFYDYENDKMLFNDANGAEAIKKIRFLVENQYLPHYDNFQDPWYGGRCAMQTYGSWAIHGDIPGPWNNNDPKGKWEADYPRPEFVLAPNPVLKEGVPGYGVLAGFGWILPKSNKYPSESVDFLWDWISDPKYGTIYLTEDRQIPCTKVVTHPWLQTNAWSAFIKQLEVSKPLIFMPAVNQINDECLAPRLIEAFAGRMSAEQALQEAYDCGLPILEEAKK